MDPEGTSVPGKGQGGSQVCMQRSQADTTQQGQRGVAEAEWGGASPWGDKAFCHWGF